MEQKVFDFENTLEEAFRDYFLQNGLVDVFTMRDTMDNKKEEKIEVRIDITGLAEHSINTTYDNLNKDEDCIGAILSIGIFTNRLEDRAPPTGYKDWHSFRTSLIRKLTLKNALGGALTDVVPFEDPAYYDIYYFKKVSESPNMQINSEITDNDIDGIIMSFELSFQIRSKYWTR
jgi:hypothetical protein